MQHSLTESVKVYIVRNKSRKWLRRVIRVLSCLVVFFTTYALILPAITLEQEVFCGLEEHSHTDECYQQTAARKLVCTPESLALHVHGAGCYDAENNLICGQADYVIHSHDGSCLDSNGMLACHPSGTKCPCPYGKLLRTPGGNGPCPYGKLPDKAAGRIDLYKGRI